MTLYLYDLGYVVNVIREYGSRTKEWLFEGWWRKEEEFAVSLSCNQKELCSYLWEDTWLSCHVKATALCLMTAVRQLPKKRTDKLIFLAVLFLWGISQLLKVHKLTQVCWGMYLWLLHPYSLHAWFCGLHYFNLVFVLKSVLLWLCYLILFIIKQGEMLTPFKKHPKQIMNWNIHSATKKLFSSLTQTQKLS